eukprot:7987502-Alexandrium_andersonii.AAC.1
MAMCWQQALPRSRAAARRRLTTVTTGTQCGHAADPIGSHAIGCRLRGPSAVAAQLVTAWPRARLSCAAGRGTSQD